MESRMKFEPAIRILFAHRWVPIRLSRQEHMRPAEFTLRANINPGICMRLSSGIGYVALFTWYEVAIFSDRRSKALRGKPRQTYLPDEPGFFGCCLFVSRLTSIDLISRRSSPFSCHFSPARKTFATLTRGWHKVAVVVCEKAQARVELFQIFSLHRPLQTDS